MSWRPDQVLRPQYPSDMALREAMSKQIAVEAPSQMPRFASVFERNLGQVVSPFLQIKPREKVELQKKNIRPARGTLRLG